MTPCHRERYNTATCNPEGAPPRCSPLQMRMFASKYFSQFNRVRGGMERLVRPSQPLGHSRSHSRSNPLLAHLASPWDPPVVPVPTGPH
eukprot:1194114-Prorocentrum_minimum.AAC.1